MFLKKRYLGKVIGQFLAVLEWKPRCINAIGQEQLCSDKSKKIGLGRTQILNIMLSGGVGCRSPLKPSEKLLDRLARTPGRRLTSFYHKATALAGSWLGCLAALGEGQAGDGEVGDQHPLALHLHAWSLQHKSVACNQRAGSASRKVLVGSLEREQNLTKRI